MSEGSPEVRSSFSWLEGAAPGFDGATSELMTYAPRLPFSAVAGSESAALSALLGPDPRVIESQDDLWPDFADLPSYTQAEYWVNHQPDSEVYKI